MPEYLTPGVYIEEFEIGARPIEGASTSTAGFIGETERGPTIPPKLVTSMTQFMRIYGGYVENSYLAYAVNGFFSNGGQRCYIGRIVWDGASPASLTLDKTIFKAVGEGSWGKRIGIRIENSSSDPKLFKLTVAYWGPGNLPKDFSKPDIDTEKSKKQMEIMEKAVEVEVFDELSEDENSPYYYGKKLSDPLKNISNFIFIDKGSSGRPPNTDESVFFVPLTDEGSDGGEKLTRDNIVGMPQDGKPAKPGERRGLTAFTEIDDISIVYVPDIHFLDESEKKTLRDDILTHCEIMKDRFAILDIDQNQTDIGSLMIQRSSKYGALYYPWIKIYDPLTKKQVSRPPGGYIAGIYARSDTERGVHKAPANELVRGADDLEFQITKQEQGVLNPRGINVIRSFPGRGILVWGARTCIVDPLWKYINVRRLFIYIEKSV
jgi:phage tail sheath protein FI